MTEITTSNSTTESSPDYLTTPPTLEDVQRVVVEEFDERTWEVTEAILAAHATLMLKNVSGGAGLIIVGPSSAGKTTALSFIDGLDDQVYRSDDVTPASFVSHDASKSDAELAEIDLLPKIRQKTLLLKDMATWFSGDQEDVYKRMSIMTHLMDGDGYTRDSGTHGKRGYIGSDYRFTFIGATTPLPPRSWNAMGTAGYRFVMHEKAAPPIESIADELLTGSTYKERVARVREVVHAFLTHMWNTTGGYGSVEMEPPHDAEVRDALTYLSKVVAASRAKIVDGEAQPEGEARIFTTLYTFAQGRALLNGRRYVTIEDLALCARLALSTIPAKRRVLIRALLDPQNEGGLTAAQVDHTLGVARGTSHKRMTEVGYLGLSECTKREGDGRKPKLLRLNPEFAWPASLTFPQF